MLLLLWLAFLCRPLLLLQFNLLFLLLLGKFRLYSFLLDLLLAAVDQLSQQPTLRATALAAVFGSITQ